jgi:hypothetical protein
MIAEGVVVLIVTVCTEVYVPATGLKVGVAAAARLMVKAAVATALFEYPVATAIAFSVSVAETLIGPLFTAELVVGVAPLVV